MDFGKDFEERYREWQEAGAPYEQADDLEYGCAICKDAGMLRVPASLVAVPCSDCNRGYQHLIDELPAGEVGRQTLASLRATRKNARMVRDASTWVASKPTPFLV